MQEFITTHISQLSDVAKKLLDTLKERKVWYFDGEMGAGKTTLIQKICSELGVQDIVQSPTFSIINEYHTTANKIIYHFDFYRINDVEEALNIGTEEYLYSGNYCFIEWASKIEPLLPEDIGVIEIQEIEDGKRKISVYLP